MINQAELLVIFVGLFKSTQAHQLSGVLFQLQAFSIFWHS